jgi:hypothetical protein
LFVCKGQCHKQKERQNREAHRHSSSSDKVKRVTSLPVCIEFAIRIKVMVTENVEIDLDITNGARGEIVDIRLHAEEPPIGNEPVIRLNHLPAYILVGWTEQGLEAGGIPVQA